MQTVPVKEGKSRVWKRYTLQAGAFGASSIFLTRCPVYGRPKPGEPTEQQTRWTARMMDQLFYTLASLRGQRLPVVLLQRPRYLPKSGSQHFSRELRCPDRKGNRFLVYFFLHKTSFPSGFPLSGRPPYNLGEQKTSGQCGPRLTARHLCRTELSFPAPSGLFRPVPAWSAR